MSYSSGKAILQKQNLTWQHGLSICLDMFVCLCEYSRIISNDFIKDGTENHF